MDRVDVIIVAFQSSDVIASCIEGLRADPAVDKIVVANNSGEDETRAIVERFPDVVYRQLDANLGYGRAVNIALEDVSQEFVVLANPDARSDDRTTSELMRFLVSHPRAAIAAPRMWEANGRLYRNSKRPLSLMRMGFEALGGPEAFQVSRPRRSHEAPHLSDYVIGSFVICRVTACESVGWFDESIFLFGEDQDLCRRLRSEGWEVWYAGVGNVIHSSGHSWRQLPDSARQHFRRARYRQLKADAGPIQAGLYRLASTIPIRH
jgi:GT2 family glycosyltransferase